MALEPRLDARGANTGVTARAAAIEPDSHRRMRDNWVVQM